MAVIWSRWMQDTDLPGAIDDGAIRAGIDMHEVLAPADKELTLLLKAIEPA